MSLPDRLGRAGSTSQTAASSLAERGGRHRSGVGRAASCGAPTGFAGATPGAPTIRSPRCAAVPTRRCWSCSVRSSTRPSATTTSWSAGSARRCPGCCHARRAAHRDRPRPAYRQILDEILGHGPIEPLLRDPEVTEIMVNAWDRIYVERFGHIHPVDAAFMDEAHLRRVIDKIVVPGGPAGRRVQPDGRRPPARRQPGQRGGAADRARRRGADHPQVRRRPVHGRRPDHASARSPSRSPTLLRACVRGRLDIVISGGTGTGKTTLLNVLSPFLPGRRAHHHHRGLGRAAAAPGARAAAGVPPAEHRGPGRGHHPRPGPQRAADAPRPHRRRRGPRRRRAGHAPGDEHRPRRLADHGPRQLAPRLAGPAGDDGADGRHGPAGAGDPRADRLAPST